MSRRAARNKADPGQLRLVGGVHTAIGMGQHARSVWRALHEVGSTPKIVDFYEDWASADPLYEQEFRDWLVPTLGDGANIFCINGDETGRASDLLRHRNLFAPGSHNIIYPLWELERYPAEWAANLEAFDEIWAPSAFVERALRAAVSKPVIHMPLTGLVTRMARLGRRHFGIRDSAFTFLFSFDFLSFLDRKNPMAVIEAFEQLLEARPWLDAMLVIKTQNSDRNPQAFKQFKAGLEPLDERVLLIDELLPDLEMKALIWLCDAYVSLHRSEGFGFGLMEAMSLAKPVIATAYSGNMDFCTDDTAMLIPYELVQVGPGEYPHWQDQVWAAADIDAAAEAMMTLVDDQAFGQQLGQRAQQHVRANFSLLATGQRYKQRLAQIGANHPMPEISRAD